MRFTKKGFDKLRIDYEDLIRKRPAAVADLKKARDMGDLSENGYYKSARGKLSSIDRDLRKLLTFLKEAKIIEHTNSKIAYIESVVTLCNGKNEVKYEIVGDMEADPSNNKISLLSPVGKAIAGKKAGDKVIIEIPTGKINYTIKNIS